MPLTNRRQFIHAGATAAISTTILTSSVQADEPAKPKRQILALGGGGFALADREHLLLKYILSLTGKKNPTICFLPTASSDNAESIVMWYDIMNELDCRPRHLRLINNATYLKDLEKRMLSMDAFYVGGGNTLNMLAVWKAQGVDAILRKAWEQGTVLSGGSAGMICWFKEGVADSLPGPMTVDKGLGWLNASVCPHYAHKDRTGHLNWKESFHRLLLAGQIEGGYACEDNVGLLYEDDKLVRIISDEPKAKAYFVRKAGDKIVEEALNIEYIKK